MSETGAGKRTFPGISPEAFQHPLDRTALSTLHKVPGMDWVVKKLLSAVGERRLRLLFLASAVRVNERQFPELHSSYLEACTILGIEEPPELFVAQNFQVNAAALGVDKPFVMVTSSLLEILDERELQCVLGHELGHVLCNHALYTTVLMLLVQLWYMFLGIPGGVYALIAIRMALLEWSRKAELTADRAGLLVSQDLEVSQRVDMKLAGGKQAGAMNIEEFKKQAAEYESAGDLLDGVLKLVLLMGQTHPFPVLRVAELEKWASSEAYQTLLSGDYPRRDRAPDQSWLDEVKASASQYKESVDLSTDPLISTLRDLSGGAAATGTELFELFKRATGLGGKGSAKDEDPQTHS